jgi:hypothetical protein
MTERFHCRIFAYTKILIGIVRRNAVGKDAHDSGIFLVRTKSHEPGRISLALEVASVVLTHSDDLVEQRSSHSVPVAKEMGRVCRYLGEIIVHEQVVAGG